MSGGTGKFTSIAVILDCTQKRGRMWKMFVCPVGRQRAPPDKTKSLKEKKNKRSGRKSSDAESLIYFQGRPACQGLLQKSLSAVL